MRLPFCHLTIAYRTSAEVLEGVDPLFPTSLLLGQDSNLHGATLEGLVLFECLTINGVLLPTLYVSQEVDYRPHSVTQLNKIYLSHFQLRTNLVFTHRSLSCCSPYPKEHTIGCVVIFNSKYHYNFISLDSLLFAFS